MKTTILLLTLTFAALKAETNPLEKAQRRLSWQTHLAAEQADTMARLAAFSYHSANIQSIHAQTLRDTVNRALSTASSQIQFLGFETAASNQILQRMSRLASATEDAIHYLSAHPSAIQGGEYRSLLQRVRDLSLALGETQNRS